MKLLVIGHARHGKDSLCEILKHNYGFKFTSSSEFANKTIIFPALQKKYDYMSLYHCFQDRVNHRKEWFNLINEYCGENPSRLTQEILAEYDIYAGLRNRSEFEASKHLFDFIIWVDASKRLPSESNESMELTAEDANIVIDNNGSQDDLVKHIDNMIRVLDHIV